MNKYETLLIEDKNALEKEIARLCEITVKGDDSDDDSANEVKKALKEILVVADSINYSVEYRFNMEWESKYRITGIMRTESLCDFDRYGNWTRSGWFHDLGDSHDIIWHDECECGAASTSLDDLREVRVTIHGTTDKASEECRRLWSKKVNAEKVEAKQSKLNSLKKQVQELELELALELA